MGFDESYWEKLYKKPNEMDGVGNAKDHARYLKAFFELEGVEIKSIIDFGFGPGKILKEAIKSFNPLKVEGIEPSHIAFKKMKLLEAKLLEINLTEWCENNKKNKSVFDLGICTSVLQYLSRNELETILPVLAKKVKYLYLTVPTDLEYERQVKEHGYVFDSYAHQRSKKYYEKILKKNFTFISMRVLESKILFNEKNMAFNDLLFRF